MVRCFAILLAAVGMLVITNQAEARGRRGGCPGGTCSVAVVSAKTADAVTPSATVVADAAADAPVAAQSAPRYRWSGRRLFSRR